MVQRHSKKRAASTTSRANGIGTDATAKHSSGRREPVRKRAPSLLILHLDSAKLRRDGLHLGGPAALTSIWAGLGMGAQAETVDATDLESLRRHLQHLAEQKREFDVVVAVGHSNQEGIRIAAEEFVNWDAFAAYLQPFSPRRLLLVACKAGGWPAASSFFQKLPLLRRIYASPVNASKHLGELMIALVPLVLAVQAPTKRQVTAAQVAIVGLTGC